MSAPLLQQAVAAHQAGDTQRAEQLYRATLAANAVDADALALLSVLLNGQGKSAEALPLIEQALQLDPKAALFHFYYANILMSSGKTVEAIAAYTHCLHMQPNLTEARYNLGNALRQMGQLDAAAAAYQQVLQLNPNYAEARNNFALTLERQGNLPLAVKELQQLVVLHPTYAEGWLNLCRVAELAGHYQLAAEAGQKATQLQPQNPSAYLGLGVALNRLEQHPAAIAAYEVGLALRPDWASTWDNLGQSYQFMNRLPEAEAAYRKTIALDGQAVPDDQVLTIDETKLGNRHWHLALLELLAGKLPLGFARYRARFGEVMGLGRPPHAQPIWQGEALAGKTILVMYEQGHGDTLMFARYLPLLKALGAKVKFLLRAPLVKYFTGWSGADVISSDEALKRGENDLGAFDYHTSVFDLPHRFGTDLTTIPADIPYLPVPKIDTANLLPATTQRRIGVVWGGSPNHKHDGRRSIPLQIFADLFSVPDCQFYSLNRDKRAGDENILAEYSQVTDLAPRLNDFYDLAQFTAQMDLIISVDTATAHLAGSMAKPVWTLLPFAPDWRWLLERTDSPWYPTMRLFRQPQSGDWRSVINEVKTKLSV